MLNSKKSVLTGKVNILSAGSFLLQKIFIFLLLISPLFFFPAKAFAASCSYIQVYDYDGNWNNFGVIGRDTVSTFVMSKSPGDRIVGRYFFNGYSWQVTSSLGENESSDTISVAKQFSETKDFYTAGGWDYFDSSGVERSLICKGIVSVFSLTVKNLGTKTLTYSSVTQATQTITQGGNYIGLIEVACDTYSGCVWGNNTNETVSGWKWQFRQNPSYNQTVGPSLGSWRTWWKTTGIIAYPNQLITQYDFDLTAATFKTGEGSGSTGNYYFGRTIVLYRSNQRNSPANPGPLPTSTPTTSPTPSLLPSPTPTPTPLPPGTSVFYGYVKCNSAFGSGIPNANIRIDTQAVQAGAYNIGAANVTTNGEGYFTTTLNNTFYGVRFYETNSAGYPLDDGAIIIPANCPNPSSLNVNTLSCSNIGTIVGPVTFLDDCQVPTSTPTPAPCDIAYCQSSGVNEKSLNNQWNQGWPFAYTTFTAPYTGDVDLVSVKAGNYGGALRAITCKVTDEAGNTDISTTLSSPSFTGSANWRDISFLGGNSFSLTGGTKYRLYCKGSDPNPMIYWIYKDWFDHGELTVNGKTFCLCMRPPPCVPTSPDAPSLVSPGADVTVTTESVDLTWNKISNWGDPCITPTSKYDVYLTTDLGCPDNPSQCGSLICSPVKADPPPATLSCSSGTLTDNTWYYWQVFSRNGALSNQSVIRKFKALSLALTLPWWQSENGDIHANGSINSLIPATATNPYLSLVGTGGSPGVASFNGTLDIGSEEGTALSETLWQAKTPYLGPLMKFDYLKNRLNVDTSQTLTCSGSPCDLPTDSGTYYLDQVNTSFTAKDFGTNKVIVFVTGNVTITGNITVSPGGFFALISKGDLKFDPTITKAQGFFSTDGTLSVEAKVVPPDTGFEGQGSFIGWSAITLDRDLGINNSTLPGVFFISRPDFYINAPTDFTFVSSIFQQIP